MQRVVLSRRLVPPVIPTLFLASTCKIPYITIVAKTRTIFTITRSPTTATTWSPAVCSLHPTHCRHLATDPQEVEMVSVLELPAYAHLKLKLMQRENCQDLMDGKPSSRSPSPHLDTACSHLLEGRRGLVVPRDILHLPQALAMDCFTSRKPQHAEVRRRVLEGSILTGGLARADQEAMVDMLEVLAAEAMVGVEELQRELFARNSEREFMLKRQLVGFFLLQELEGGERRVPVEAVAELRMATILATFTEEEDARMVAWVARRGAARWPELAKELGRDRKSVV